MFDLNNFHTTYLSPSEYISYQTNFEKFSYHLSVTVWNAFIRWQFIRWRSDRFYHPQSLSWSWSDLVPLIERLNPWKLNDWNLGILNLCEIPCSFSSILQILSFHQSNKICVGICIYKTIQQLYWIPAQMSSSTLLCQYWKYETDDKCYGQLGRNVKTNLAVTLRLSWP